MRLRGPWIIRGILLDTSVSSQSGTILGNDIVAVVMSPYSFFPDVLQRRALNAVEINVRYDFVLPPNAEMPKLMLYNIPGGPAPYAAEWRHVNP